jgi:hypothetical protein
MFYFLTLLLSVSASFAAAPVPQAELRLVETRVSETFKKGQTPVLIFDLDETLIDSTPRKYMALRDAVKEICGYMNDHYDYVYPAVCTQGIHIHQSQIYALSNRYALSELFTISSSYQKEILDDFMDRVFTFYLSGKHLELDREIPGAVSFVRKMRELGAKLYFVSSRSDSSQREGTLASLRTLGMDAPTLEQEVILKPDGMRSLEFKQKTFAMIHQQPGEVVGVFENEPENINAMIQEFPHAQAYLIRGAWLIEGDVDARAIQLDDFYTF